MRKIILAAIAISLCLSASSCGRRDVAPTPDVTPSPSPSVEVSPAEVSPPMFQFTRENMPEIDGSTATIPLIEAVNAVLLGIPRSEAAELVNTTGTDNAYERLINKEVDILMVYAPAQSSLEYAESRRVELLMAPIGRDGLVFLINKLNTVENLTVEQLVSIYSGEVSNWAEVGGDDMEIKAFQRQLRSGSQTMMDALVMRGVPMAETEAAYVIGEMGGLVEAVAAYDGASSAIGYNVFYYVTRMKMDENIKLLSVGGVAPSKETISSGEYPFVNDFYVVIRSDAQEGSPERILYDWIQSPDGQALVDNEGYAVAKK